MKSKSFLIIGSCIVAASGLWLVSKSGLDHKDQSAAIQPFEAVEEAQAFRARTNSSPAAEGTRASSSGLSGSQSADAGEMMQSKEPNEFRNNGVLDRALESATLVMEGPKQTVIRNGKRQNVSKQIYALENTKYPLLLTKLTETQSEDGSWQSRRSAVVADHMVVKVKPSVTEDALSEICEKHGCRILNKMQTKDLYIVAFEAEATDTLDEMLKRFNQEDLIAYAEVDAIATACAIPNDPRFAEQDYLNSTADIDIDAPEAWDITTGSPNVVVTIIDGAIDENHADIKDNIWINTGEIPGNNIDDDGNGYKDDVYGWNALSNNGDMSFYLAGHATMMAGLVGAKGNNGRDIAGVCWNVKMANSKVFGLNEFGYSSDLVEAITYTNTTESKIILFAGTIDVDGPLQSMYDAIRVSQQMDKLFICAAGNSNDDLAATPVYPAALDLDNILTVTATNETGEFYPRFSNFGDEEVDLAAPGKNLLTTYSWGNVQGAYETGLNTTTGTSGSSALVAGSAALLLSACPNLTYDRIKQILMDSSDPLPSLVGKCVSGGRLNVHKALLSLELHGTLQLPIDDDALSGTSGNADGIINPGEVVGLNVSVHNEKSRTINNVKGTLSLVGTSPYVSITQGTKNFGNLASSVRAPGSYLITVAPGTPTPYAFSVEHKVTGDGETPKTTTWNFVVSLSSTVSGTVTSGGVPLAGATVTYTGGPTSGVLTTAANGTYSVVLPNGNYSLVASAAGLSVSPPRLLNVPPGQSGVNFELGLSSISIAPNAIDSHRGPGQIATPSLNIQNAGTSDLYWSLDMPNMYSWSAPSSSGYNWIEISGTGTVANVTTNSSVIPDPVDIGFDFPFYGKPCSQLRMYPNGFINFVEGWNSNYPNALPYENSPPAMIALFWSRLVLEAGSNVYYQLVDPDTFVIQWKDMCHYSDLTKKVTAQMVLKSDGRIFLNYKNAALPQLAVVGMQNELYTQGFTAYLNQTFDTTDSTILILPVSRWLEPAALSGIVPAGTTSTLDLAMNANLVQQGINYTSLLFRNNTLDTPVVNVPVTFTIDSNRPPVVTTAPWTDVNPPVLPGETIHVVASDPDSDSLKYTWSKVTGPGTVNFSPNGTRDSHDSEVTFSAAGNYTLKVDITDGIDTVTRQITMTVLSVNRNPIVNAGSDQSATLIDGVNPRDPLAGAYYEWDAVKDIPNNNSWTSSTENNFTWSFDLGKQTPAAVTDARLNRLTKAYVFPAAKDASNASFNGKGDTEPATFEFVIDIDGTDGSIFETAASADGLQLDIVGGVLRGTVAEKTPVRTSYTLTTEDMGRFIHVVLVADNVNDVVQLYVDGNLKDSKPWTTGNDWASSGNSCLGGNNGGPNGGSTDDFIGKMALCRYYRNTAFTAAAVRTNFDALSYGPAVTVNLNGTANDPDGHYLYNTWSVASTEPAGLPVSFQDATALSTTAKFIHPGTYRLRLSSDDGLVNAPVTDEVIIQVNAPGSPATIYSNWISNYNVGALTGFDQDADGDGMVNGLELAFGTNPSTLDMRTLAIDGTRHGAPLVSPRSGGGFDLYFMRRIDHGTSGSLNYTARFSDDLVTFYDSMVGLQVVSASSVNSDYQVVKVPFPSTLANGKAARFGRVKVELNR